MNLVDNCINFGCLELNFEDWCESGSMMDWIVWWYVEFILE